MTIGRRPYPVVFLAMLMVFLPASEGLAKRVALVIGNSAYEHATPLRNPHRDATAVAAALQRLGFDIGGGVVQDADVRTLLRQARKFRGRSKGADLALVYYAGHAIQVDSKAFLVGTDGALREVSDVGYDTVSLSLMLGEMRGRVNVFVLDACRDNPFGAQLERSARRMGRNPTVSRGLPAIDSRTLTGGSLVAMAAAPGAIADDGTAGGHSPYASALLKHLEEPGLPLRLMFAKVREEVERQTGGEQKPEAIDRLPAEAIYLGDAPRSGGGAVRPAFDAEAVLCRDLLTGRGDRRAFEAYLSRYSKGQCRDAVSVKLAMPVPSAAPVASKPRYDIDVMDAEYVVLKRSNLRSGPGTGHGKVGRLAARRRVTVTGRIRGKPWYRIEHGDGEAYIWAPLLAEAGPGETDVVAPSGGPAESVSGSGLSSSGREWSDPVTGMQFVSVPGGSFEMGCGSWTSNCYDDEKPVRRVRLDGFWLGKHEVTQGEWSRVMGSNPSKFKKGDRHPVEMVFWDEAQSFIRKLNGMGSATFSLPSEAQWEYACRSGGKGEKYAGSGDVGSLAWYSSNSGGATHAAGSKRPNGLGLYDMSGNVSEWVQDSRRNRYPSGSETNPIYEVSGSLRVARGGSWYSNARYSRCSNRRLSSPGHRRYGPGFRLLRKN